MINFNYCKAWEDTSAPESDSSEDYPCDKCKFVGPISDMAYHNQMDLCSDCLDEIILEEMEAE